jgi:hypothetical protein
MKKIVFIGGTSRSGSTILDTIISNNEKAMSLGEIHALLYPYRKHYFEIRNKTIESDTRWKKIIEDGENKLFTNLIKLFPKYDVFVDSSKNPYWIKKHVQILDDKDIDYFNILIYKTPYEIADSFYKRGLDWRLSWKNIIEDIFH